MINKRRVFTQLIRYLCSMHILMIQSEIAILLRKEVDGIIVDTDCLRYIRAIESVIAERAIQGGRAQRHIMRRMAPTVLLLLIGSINLCQLTMKHLIERVLLCFCCGISNLLPSTLVQHIILIG